MLVKFARRSFTSPINWRKNPFPEIEVFPQTSVEGYKLINYRWKPEGRKPKATIMLLHGYGSYCGKYGYAAKPFVDAGYEVVGFDF